MRSTLPAVIALMVLALALVYWPGKDSHPVARTAVAADDFDQSLIAPSKKAQPVAVDANPFPATSTASKKARPARPLITTTPDERAANIEYILKSSRIDLDFTGQPLNEVMDFVHDQFPELSFQFDNQSLKDAGIDPTTSLVTIRLQDARLKTALELMLEQFNLDYYIHDGLPIIATKEKVDCMLETRIYDCRDLLAVDSDRYHRYPNQSSTESSDAKTHSPVSDLIEVITSSTARQTWAAHDGSGTISEYDGLLVINQTREVHSQIADLLEKLSAKLASREKK